MSRDSDLEGEPLRASSTWGRRRPVLCCMLLSEVRMPACSRLGVIVLVALAGQILNAQSQSAANPSTPLIRSTRREVLVDLVVRDKHHRLITNLRPAEVEVYEDGVRQKINAFGNVAGREQLETERSQ